MRRPDWNPPAEGGRWRGLSEEAKWAWLVGVRDHHFANADRGLRPPKRIGQTFVLDGEHIEDLPSFFCAMGEAVNGPGGYFGSQMMAFFDALHGGFGLDAPCTIRWRNSAMSRCVLNSAVFASELDREAKRNRELLDLIDQDVFLKRRAQAEAGIKTMFDEIVETIEASSGGAIRLVLE